MQKATANHSDPFAVDECSVCSFSSLSAMAKFASLRLTTLRNFAP